MDINDIKDSIADLELQKFEKILNLCQSPIEKVFIGKLYEFFLSIGCNITLLTQFSENIVIEDSNIYSQFYVVNSAGLKVKVESENSIYVDPYIGEVMRLTGFEVNCSGLIYRFLPQYPIFDFNNLHYADFVIEVHDLKGSKLQNFVVECNGYEWHSSKEQLERDSVRNTFIVKHGYKTLPITGRQIMRNNIKFALEFENTLYHSIFGKDSGIYKLKTC